MADSTEKKTYLINIEDNLNKYAEDAAKAKAKVDELKSSNDQLKQSGKASAAEIESSNAALRNAQKEYNQAKKLVDLQTQANNSNVNSRKQLATIVAIEQQRLGQLKDTIVLNADGTRSLSQEYTNQVKALDNAKKAIIAYDQAQSDGRSNVGRYTDSIKEAFKGMSGPIGDVSDKISGLSAGFKALIANPVVGALTAILAVLTGLWKVFTGTAEGAGKLKDIMASLRAITNELRARVVSLIDAFGHLFKGEFKAAGEAFKDTFTDLGDSLKYASEQAAELSRQQRALNKELAFRISEEAEEKQMIEKLLYLSKDRTLSDKQRLDYLKQALEIGEEQAQKEKEYKERQFNVDVGNAALKGKIDQETLSNWIKMNAMQQGLALETSTEIQSAYNLIGREGVEALENSFAAMKNAETAFFQENKRAMSQYSGLLNELSEERKKQLDEEAKKLQDAKDNLNKGIEDYKKRLSEYRKADIEKQEQERQDKIDQQEWEQERELVNQENLLSIRESTRDYEFDIQRKRLSLQQKAEIESAKKTGADVNIIKAKYAAAQRQIDQAEADAKLSLYSDFAGNLANIFGEQTAIGKAAAIAQTTIATYQSATEAYKSLVGIPVVGPTLAVVAAASAVASGLANVKKIVSVKSGLPGDSGGSAPSSINTATERSFAPGASILNMPNLSQEQLNQIPQAGTFTPEEFVKALQNMPAPVVTVEDINARTAQKNKVEVRAKI